ncbi:MAG: PAS domain-containing protein [Pseudomonadota bacterium]
MTDSTRQPPWSRGLAAAVGLAVMLVFGASAVFVHRVLLHEQTVQREQRAGFAADRLRDGSSVLEDVASDLADLFARTGTVDAETFRVTVETVVGGSPAAAGVRGVALIPEVPRGMEVPLEMWPASTAAVAYPAVFAWPPEAAPQIRGFDLWTDPSRRRAAAAAIRSGEPRASDFVVLTQDASSGSGGDPVSSLLVTPIEGPLRLVVQGREIVAERGLVAIGVSVERFFEDLFYEGEGPTRQDVAVIGPIETAAGERIRRPVFVRGPEGAVPQGGRAFAVPFAGLDLSLIVATVPTVLDDVVAVAPLALLIAGTVVTVVVVIVLGRLQRANQREATSARRLRDLHDLAMRVGGMGLWSFDANAREVVVDARMARLAGLPPGGGSLALASFLDRLHPDDRPRIDGALDQGTSQGEPFRLDCRVSGEARGWRWLELDLVPLAAAGGPQREWVGVGRDVTERKRTAERLRLSEERFQLASRATRDIIWDWDVDHDAFWCSDAYASIAGSDLTLWPKTLHEALAFVHAEDRDRVADSLMAAVHGEAEVWSADYRIVRHDGSVASVLDRAFVLRDAAGQARRVVGGLADVTALRALDARLHQTEKLETLGQLTGGVAHDFNNLLTIILGNAELLAETTSDATTRELANVILLAAERGAGLTSNLLAFSRRQPLLPRPTDVADLIRANQGLLRQAVHEGIDLVVDLEAEHPVALVDPSKLQAALLNLVVNARQAIPGNGTVRIETADVTLDEAAAEATGEEVAPGAYVVVTVSDDGVGMSPEVAAQAFDPFFTTKATGSGTGLGLSSVYGFAKQSGGHARLVSRPGEGTSVRLYLPRAQHRAGDGPAASRSGAVTGGGEHVLVVEDDAALRAHVVAQLRRSGYRVSEAGDAAEALACLDVRPDVDLLFTDVVMPGRMDGRDLAEAAKARRPGLPVLFTSGYPRDAIVHDGRLDEGVELLSKPYRFDDLAQRVATVLAKAGGGGETEKEEAGDLMVPRTP